MHIKSLAMLTVASVPSVHRLQRSLLLTFANASVCWPVSIFRTLNGSQNLQRLLTAWPSGRKLQSTLSLRGAFYPKCGAKNDELALSKSTGSETGESFQAPAYDGLCTKAKDHSEEEKRDIYESFSTPFLKQRSEEWTRKNWNSKLNMRNKIFCNRSLNMNSIVAVGFDMDYTLGQYQPDAFESLAYHGTTKKLVFDLGYPRELLEWNFDWQYMLRGLVLDKKRGNILKMDRHKYVKVAYHGFREMSRDDRMATYCNTLSRESYDEPDYALIDTLFSLPEAYLFAQLVEFKDSSPDKFPAGTDYAPMYRDVRAAVDLCHRDGTLKQAVAQNPSKYIRFDSELVPMLKMLRNSGRMTFLVTNSLWDYTHVVMNYLCGKCGTDGGMPRDDEWLQFFDLVLTGSAKPSFFADGNRAPLYEVDIRTGMLQNTDNGSPLVQIGDRGMSQSPFAQKEVKQACRVFQGGNVAHLHRLIGIEAGAQVLYVGDHIYGDILRSKKDLGWRTMLIVPELEKELELFHQTVGIRKEFRLLRQKREILDDKIQQLKWPLRFNSHSDEDLEKLELEISALEVERDRVRELHRQAQRVCHQKYHKTWGQLMKTGYQNSRFAHQVERFACLYTSQVTNLCYYSPDKSYRTIEDIMPHELQDIDL